MSILQTAQRGNGLSPLYPHGNEPRAPYNLEAEQALLGALLINNQAAEYIPDLAAEHFYSDIHGRIFEAMSDSLLNNRTFTAVSLAEKFRDYVISSDLNGAQYLGRLMANATTIINVREYARVVVECFQRRQLILLAEDIATRAFDPNDPAKPSELIEEAERRLFQASIKDRASREVSFSDALEQAVNAANRAFQLHGSLDGVTTGYADLDRKLGGLGNGNLIILGGRPSMGKTALATGIAHNVAGGGTRSDPDTGELINIPGGHVHFFSQEMTALELAMRQLGEHSGISSERLRRGDFEEKDFRAVQEQQRRLAALPITIDETGGITMTALATKARRMKRKKNTKLIVVDYLQLMSPPAGRGGNRVGDITEMTMALKALAKELNVPIVALSQLSRKVEERTDKRPQLADLRESGSIEQDADVVLFVYREEYYLERTKPSTTDLAAGADWEARMDAARGKAEVIVGKQRHGSVGIVEMAFQGALTRFSDLYRGNAP
jgi:replicative DNA helicase